MLTIPAYTAVRATYPEEILNCTGIANVRRIGWAISVSLKDMKGR